jgi:hypothetical protein
MAELLDTYYPERTVTITSADPPYCTPAIKFMCRRKNQLMRSGRVEKAKVLALKIGEVITKFNSAELSRVSDYTAPSVKATANNSPAATRITNLWLFNALDTLRPTATSLDNIPADWRSVLHCPACRPDELLVIFDGCTSAVEVSLNSAHS